MMQDARPADKRRPPTDHDLAEALGRAKRHWDALLDDARRIDPAVRVEWKYYASQRQWTCVARDKRRNLLYLTPGERRFMASLAIDDRALEALQEADLPGDLVRAIKEAPRYPEGRPARVEVKSAAALSAARKLLAAKMAAR